MSSIQLIPSYNINPIQWEACLLRHSNDLLYNDYNYLNTLCSKWIGVIINDYEAVLPLPFKQKWAINYYCITPFIQKTALVGSLSQNIGKAIAEKIIHFANYGDINLATNHLSMGNAVPAIKKKLSFST